MGEGVHGESEGVPAMSYLERLKRRNKPTTGTDKTDKRAFVGFVSIQGGAFRGFEDRETKDERAAILEYDAGYSRPEAERLAGLP